MGFDRNRESGNRPARRFVVKLPEKEKINGKKRRKGKRKRKREPWPA